LSEDAARGENADLSLLPAPALTRNRNIGVNLTMKLTGEITGVPDLPLERFQGSGFSISVHQPVDISRNGCGGLIGTWGKVETLFPEIIGMQIFDFGLHLRVLPVLLEVRLYMPARVGEKALIDKVDGSGCALNVEEQAMDLHIYALRSGGGIEDSWDRTLPACN
jgi:hypothetical protein